jgi:hypothetical protein
VVPLSRMECHATCSQSPSWPALTTMPRAEGARRGARGLGEDRRAGRRAGGADWALLPSERQASGARARAHARASCKARDAVTVALASAL